MTFILTWISLVIASLGLIFLGRWVKKEAQIYALLGLSFTVVSLITIVSFLKY